MNVLERIWLTIFTFSELMTAFLCYFRKESFSYEILLFAVPVGMAFLYICLFGIKRPFETDVAELAIFQVYLIVAAMVVSIILLGSMPAEQLKENGMLYLLLGMGAFITLVVQDVMFVLIFVGLGKVFGLESMFSKLKKENEQFYQKDSTPYGGYRNVYEKMYWEELERRQREEFKRKWKEGSSKDIGKERKTAENTKSNNGNGAGYWQEAGKMPERFLFEHTVYFKCISRLEQVRPRYISLMKQHHPDMKGGSKEICQEIQNEYDTICKENGL